MSVKEFCPSTTPTPMPISAATATAANRVGFPNFDRIMDVLLRVRRDLTGSRNQLPTDSLYTFQF